MAFTFDSTIGGATSNSYVSVTEADDYFSGHFSGFDKWDALDTTEKQRILVQSTNRLDEEKFGGQKRTTTQALQWPRTFILDRDALVSDTNTAEGIGGRTYRDDTILPRELKQATCEQALQYIKLRDGDFTYEDDDVEVIGQVEIGPLKYTMRPNLKSNRLCTNAKRLLKAIGPNGWLGEMPIKLER